MRRTFLAIGVTAGLLAMLMARPSKWRWAREALLERSPVCGFGSAWAAYWEGAIRRETAQKLREGSRRLIQEKTGVDLWSTPAGEWWIPAYESHVLYALLAELEGEVYGQGERGVRPGDVVLDCGAHVGLYTAGALKAGAKLVVAIEPGPEALVCLRRNLEKEIASGRVVVYPRGVWDREEDLVLETGGSSAGRFVREGPKGGPGELRVRLTRIDAIVAELRLERVDFIKMDIEGAEVRALEGAGKTLRDFRPRLAIAGYHHREDAVTIPAAARKAWPGYVMDCGPCWGPLGSRPSTLFLRPTAR